MSFLFFFGYTVYMRLQKLCCQNRRFTTQHVLHHGAWNTERAAPSWSHASPVFLSTGVLITHWNGTFRNSGMTSRMVRVSRRNILLSSENLKAGGSENQPKQNALKRLTFKGVFQSATCSEIANWYNLEVKTSSCCKNWKRQLPAWAAISPSALVTFNSPASTTLALWHHLVEGCVTVNLSPHASVRLNRQTLASANLIKYFFPNYTLSGQFTSLQQHPTGIQRAEKG